VGIMNVVTDVGSNMDDDPTWDEAIATFNAARPEELVRSPHHVTVVYRYADGVFIATSPEVRGFRVTGRNLREARTAAREDLEKFLDPAVEVRERVPGPDPEICTAAAGRGSRFEAGELPALIVLSSSGTAGTFVTSPRTSRRRERVS
jgi:predicted RNase H-like HicB family nuclease